MRRALAGVAIAGIFLLGADPAPPQAPKSLAAIEAIQKADTAQKNAREDYNQAIFKARKVELDELHNIMKVTTIKGDLDEANAINALTKSILADMAQAESGQLTAANIQGNWKLYFGRNTVKWTITANAVHHSLDDQVGIPNQQGNVMVVKWPSGATDRLTFEGDRFFFEAWGAGQPTDERVAISLGVRDISKN